MVAKTLFGFEEILARELRNLGASRVKTGTRMVSFYGDLGFMYKANLCLRTALKILKPIASKRIRNDRDLYNFISTLPWEDYLNANETFAIYSTVHSEVFRHSQYCLLYTSPSPRDRTRSRMPSSA